MNKTIVFDTRQQKGKHEHILQYFNENNYNVVRSKLYVGDVTYVNDMSICIDTKANILELVQNVVSDHERFMNEIKKAEQANIKLVFLVQDYITENIDDLYFWDNPRKKYSPKATSGTTLAKSLKTIEKYHNTKFYFCHPANTGQTIIDILEHKI